MLRKHATRYCIDYYSPMQSPGCNVPLIHLSILVLYMLFACLFMVALCNRADHIYFHPVSSSSFFSLPNLSSRRLDVYHTSAHGVVLV